MSFEVTSRLQDFIRQEQAMLDHLLQLRRQHEDVGAEIGKTIISEGVAAFASELFESSTAGRYGHKITKTYIAQKQKEAVCIQEKSIESQHDSLVQSIRSLLNSISLKTPRLREPNSFKFVEKLDKAQESVRIETRIRRTITTLTNLLGKPFIYNKDIQTQLAINEVIIPPGEPFSASLKLKEILKGVQGYAKIIDPYVDETTLELLVSIPREVPVKVLTAYTGGEEKDRKLKKACQLFRMEKPQFEMRKCEPNLFHDRFILTQTQGWNAGASLKDMGKKLSMIKEISPETKQEAEKIFNQVWVKSINLVVG